MNPEDYVSYPVALALKKAGFDWECDHVYIRDRQDKDKYEFADWTVDSRNWNKRTRPQSAISAPTLWQAQKWLREVHSLHVDISTHGKNSWTTSITGFNDEDIPVGYLHPVNAQAFDNYESALSAGIAAALELIEKKGE